MEKRPMSRLSHRLALASLIIGSAHVASAQTADEIVERCLTAIGGRTALAFTINIAKVEHNIRVDETLFSK
jgi:hypothetical protein